MIPLLRVKHSRKESMRSFGFPKSSVPSSPYFSRIFSNFRNVKSSESNPLNVIDSFRFSSLIAYVFPARKIPLYFPVYESHPILSETFDLSESVEHIMESVSQ